MDFRNSNRLNIFVNVLSGNFLPMTSKKTKLPILFKIYSIIVWLIELVYFTACIFGLFCVPREKALKDGTVNLIVLLEIIVLSVYLHSRKNLLHELIGKLNHLIEDNEMLRDITLSIAKPIVKSLTIYTIANTTAVVVWIALPLLEILRKNEFYYSDYGVPAVISNEPFSTGIFIGGVALQILGAAYTIIRKIGLDLYTMHFIILMTAQYKYLRIKIATIFKQEPETLCNNIVKRNISSGNERTISHEMRLLTRHYETVVEMAVMLRKLLSPNIGILYVEYVFRFCFISFMLVTICYCLFCCLFFQTVGFFPEKCLFIMYALSLLIQFYILCYSIQKLIEASETVTDDVIHEKWYFHDVSLQRAIVMMILTNKLECKLSSLQSIDLTLPSFMSVLNQAYSICLLFLKARRE
ncbi:hypothetical protein E2986_12642 [Frieseomelitta varia]|uniref:Odorant receptor n=1 Tax=Frieseomelitta varia TaxID=561572 RepID=A0A833SDS2_9HYME|nr:hypothetical protein E2986_12642 [Frieseomelitta varia]